MNIHLTDPDCPQSVRDQINGAAQPIGQAIEQPEATANAIIEVARTIGFFSSVIKSGEPWTETCQRDYDRANAAIRALSVSASEREALEARVKSLEAAVAQWKHTATNRAYMMNAYINMLGPKGLEVAGMWAKKGVQRFHADWTGEAAKLTGEDRAQTILDWEAAPKREVDPREIDGDLSTQPFDAALNGAKP